MTNYQSKILTFLLDAKAKIEKRKWVGLYALVVKHKISPYVVPAMRKLGVLTSNGRRNWQWAHTGPVDLDLAIAVCKTKAELSNSKRAAPRKPINKLPVKPAAKSFMVTSRITVDVTVNVKAESFNHAENVVDSMSVKDILKKQDYELLDFSGRQVTDISNR